MQLRHVASAALLLLSACNLTTRGSSLGSGEGRIQIVNGARDAGAVQVYLDGAFQGSVPVGNVGIAPRIGGDHLLEVRRSNGAAGFVYPITIIGAEAITIVAFDSSGVLRPFLMSDTGAVVPPGATKLRVAHFAAAAGPIDIWRTQPDNQTPIRVMVPFNYQDESPYLQSTPGDWQVLVSDTVPQSTPSAPMPDTLALTLVPVPVGMSRTVLVLDRLTTGVQLVILEP